MRSKSRGFKLMVIVLFFMPVIAQSAEEFKIIVSPKDPVFTYCNSKEVISVSAKVQQVLIRHEQMRPYIEYKWTCERDERIVFKYAESSATLTVPIYLPRGKYPVKITLSVYPVGSDTLLAYGETSFNITIQPRAAVTITVCPPKIADFGEAVAVGEPEGGIYEWSYETTSGTGEIDFGDVTSGRDLDTVNIEGITPSSEKQNIKITVKYIRGSYMGKDTATLSVIAPNRTEVVHETLPDQIPGSPNWGRFYYHGVWDQFEDRIREEGEGLFCDETVIIMYGPNLDLEADGNLHDYGDPAGMSVRDEVSVNPTMPTDDGVYAQTIEIDGYMTSPVYTIWYRPGISDDPIWKTPSLKPPAN